VLFWADVKTVQLIGGVNVVHQHCSHVPTTSNEAGWQQADRSDQFSRYTCHVWQAASNGHWVPVRGTVKASICHARGSFIRCTKLTPWSCSLWRLFHRRILSEVRVNARFQKIPCLMGRLGSGIRVSANFQKNPLLHGSVRVRSTG